MNISRSAHPVVAVLLLLATAFVACGGAEKKELASPCQITPPESWNSEDKKVAKGNLEGAYMDYVKGGASGDASAEDKVNVVFAKVGDHAKTCELVGRLTACAIRDNKQDILPKLADVVSEKCAPGVPPTPPSASASASPTFSSSSAPATSSTAIP